MICPLIHRHDPDRPRRSADGTILCRGCLDRLERDVVEMPALHDGLLQRLPATYRGRAEVGEGRQALAIADNPIPIDPMVAEHRDHMRRLLATWASLAAEEAGVHGPGTPRLDRVSVWLHGRLTWVVAQPWVDEMADELRLAAGRARAIIAANPRRSVVIAPCPAEVHDEDGEVVGPCVGTLTADLRPVDSDHDDALLPDRIVCSDDAGHEWSPSQWHALARRLGRPMDEGPMTFVTGLSA